MADQILTHPDSRLRRTAETIDLFDDALAEQCQILEATMRSGPGGVGIAAPQIGINQRLIVIDCRESRRPCKHHGLLYMVNPVIEAVEGERIGREGCLSVPDWVGMVPRAARIDVSYHDLQGKPQLISASGFEARVIQHEIDHLDGILFIDRIVSGHEVIRRMGA